MSSDQNAAALQDFLQSTAPMSQVRENLNPPNGQYDLVVYQLGNSSVHDFTWPYLFRWPGLVVMHDTSLHHARAQALLGRLRLDAYRAEFAWNHPGVRPAATIRANAPSIALATGGALGLPG